MNVVHDVPVDVLGRESDKDDREDAGHHRDHCLHTHNEGEAHHPSGDN